MGESDVPTGGELNAAVTSALVGIQTKTSAADRPAPRRFTTATCW